MRFFLWLLALFATAIGLAVLARYNAGNVVLFYPPYRVDLSLNFFLLLAVLLFVSLFSLLNALRVAQRMPRRVAEYRRERREREGNKALRDALRALFEGRFGHSEKAAMRALDVEQNAGLAALIGARAAHRMSQSERRDAWLLRSSNDPALKTARLMTGIELLVDEHRPEAALDAVRELNASGTRHIHALRLALKANQRAKNWTEVLRLLRALDKANAVHPALSLRLRELAYEDLLSDRSNDPEVLRRIWSEIPAGDRLMPVVACTAATAFNARGMHEEATALIEKALAAEWDDRLVRAYRDGAAAQGSPALLAQIERCEQWLLRHPSDAELALTLGALCFKQKLWGKAQRNLELALADASESHTVREAHLLLASLFEALGQEDKAATHYRQCALATAF
jgi:HemY protein